jgi:hypothetical protein
MTIDGELSKARRRAQIKRSISDLLRQLPAADRQAVLAELLVDAESPASAPEPARVQTAGRPPSNGSGGPKKTAIIIERLEKKPGTPIAELAQAAYGDATKQSQTKVRSLLAALKKQGRVKKMRGKKAGRWQIAT